MLQSPVLLQDPARLAALRASGLLDTPPEESFDRLTRLAARLLHAPVSLLCLLDAERQFFKSQVGLGEPWASRREMPLAYSFCQYALDRQEPLVIPDAGVHPWIHDSLAVAELGSRAYVGVPLAVNGQVLGTLCVVDTRPRDWTPDEVEALADLAGVAVQEIGLREALERSALVQRATSDTIWDWDVRLGVVYRTEALLRALGYPPETVGRDSAWWVERIHPADRDRVASSLDAAVRGSDSGWSAEYRFRRADGAYATIQAQSYIQRDAAGGATRVIGSIRDITDRRRAEEELCRRERQLAEAQRLARVGSWDWEVETGTTSWSDEHFRLLGYEPGSITPSYQAFLDRVVPEDRERALEEERRALEGGRRFAYQARVELPGGELRTLAVQGSVVLDADNRPVRMIGTKQDITERVQADARLAQAEAHYRRLVMASPVAIYALDAEGRFTELNPAGEQLLQRPAPGMVGRHFAEVVAPGDLEATQTAFVRILSGAVDRLEMELHVVRPSGEPRLLQITVTAIVEGARVVGLHGIARDITEQRARERQTRLLATALEGLRTEGVQITDMQGRVVYANATHARLLGYDPDRHGELSVGDFMPDEQSARQAAETLRAVDRTGSWRGTVRRRRLSDGETVALDALIGRVADDQRVLYVAILQDASQRLAHERQLRRAERLASMGTLISGVAHELNNPLHAISNFAELMLMDERGPDDREALEIIVREASRAARVVSDLRQLSRQTQEQEGERELVDLNEVVRHVAKLRRYALATHNVELEEQPAPDLPPVLADRPQLEQVLLNLVINAEQAMQGQERAKRILVRTHTTGSRVVVQVADTGPGIDPASVERVFDPFWTTKAPGQGMGLGLSLVHSIVREHDGEVRVTSEPGQGAEFVVELPVAPGARWRASPEEPAATPARALRVLVVDDEPANRRLLVRHLERRGHQVAEAEEGAEALARIAEASYDVVVSDLRMPGLGGDELLAALRRQGHVAAQRLVFVTGDAASGDTSRIVATSGVPVLFKPVDLAELTRVIELQAESLSLPG